MRKFKLLYLAVPIALIMAAVAFPWAVSANPPVDAAITAKPGQIISGITLAGGHQIGIYVPPGANGVIIKGVTISGEAKDGILVQDASGVIIEDSCIESNGKKGIILEGTTGCIVQRNIIKNNSSGGMGIYDDGPFPHVTEGAFTANAIASRGNLITGNWVEDNTGACEITLAAWNVGNGGVYSNVISQNNVTDAVLSGDPPVQSGGIILGVGVPSGTMAANNVFLNNTISGGSLAGIIIHNFGGTISGTQIIGNNISNNGAGDLSTPATAGIEIGPAPITQTQLIHNTISNDDFGVFILGSTAQIIGDTYNSITIKNVGP